MATAPPATSASRARAREGLAYEGRSGGADGSSAIAYPIPERLFGRKQLRSVPRSAALASRIRLPGLRQQALGDAEEPGAHLRMPRLRPSNIDHCRHGLASLQVADVDVVLGCASHGDTFERHVRTATRGATRRHL